MFRYNISAESLAKSTLSQGHGLSTGGVRIYIYISYLFTYDLLVYQSYVGPTDLKRRRSTGANSTQKVLQVGVRNSEARQGMSVFLTNPEGVM